MIVVDIRIVLDPIQPPEMIVPYAHDMKKVRLHFNSLLCLPLSSLNRNRLLCCR